MTRFERTVRRLLRFYRPSAGRWRPATGEAWQLALAIEAVATAYERTRDPSYVNALTRWFARHHARRSRFFDDDGWYVNAWLRCYDVTGDPAFLAAARAGFAELRSGWDDVCGGGLWWSHDRTYKNAITNELFLLAAARLARRSPGGDHAEWALRAWTWFDQSGLINVDGLVNDGLDGCLNNGGTTWTYNQGVLLGGLVELERITGDAALTACARRVAAAATAGLAPGGILREPNEPDCDPDQRIFKGVLAQGLGRLGSYEEFLRRNAESVWHRARDRYDGIGLCWAGPPGRVTAATHASGTLLLGAGGESTVARPADVLPVDARFAVTRDRSYAMTLHYRVPRDGYVAVRLDGALLTDRLLLLGGGDRTVSVDVPLSAGDHEVLVEPAVVRRLSLR